MQAATRSSQASERNLEMEKFSDASVTCIKLKGAFDEQFDAKRLAAPIKCQTLVLDLSGVVRVSSFGIREWMSFLRLAEKAASEVFLIGCSPKVVNQFNMVADFLGQKSRVFSLYAPYRCDTCETVRDVLLNVDRDCESIKQLKAPEQICVTCGNPEVFDEDPRTFFLRISQQGQFELGASVESLLVSRLGYPASDVARRVQAQKIVQKRSTYLRLLGNLDASLQPEKLAEGLEGAVAVDVTGLGTIDPAGAAQFRRFLGALVPNVDRIFLVGCPQAFLERAIQQEDLGKKVEVLSFAMPYVCAKCSTRTSQLIDVAEHHAVLKVAIPPQMVCKDCGGTTTCAATGALISRLPSLPKPTADNALRKAIRTAQKQKIFAATPAKMPGQRANYSAVVVGGLLIVLGVAAAGYYQQQKTKEAMEAVVSTLSLRKRPEWITSDTPSFAYCTELTARTVCVGISSYTNSKEDGRTEAIDAALEALVNTVGLKIDDAAFGAHLRRAYAASRQELLSNLPHEDTASVTNAKLSVREARSRVARGLERTGSAAVPTQPTDWYWEQYATTTENVSDFLVFVRYDVSRDAVASLVQLYGQTTGTLGAKVLTIFPAMGWKYSDASTGVLVFELGAGALRDLGVHQGDIILAVDDHAIDDGTDFAASIGRRVTDTTATGGTVRLRVRRGDGEPLEISGELGRNPKK